MTDMCHIVYPNLSSAIQPVSHSGDLPPSEFMSFVDDSDIENENMEYGNLQD